MQGCGQAGSVVVPEQDVEYRRLVAQQIVIDPVVPDQVVGPHPGKYLGHVSAFQNAVLIGHAPGGLDRTLVGKQRDLCLDAGVQHADQQGEGVYLLFLQRSVVAQQGRCGNAAGAGAEHAQILAAGDFQDDVDGFLQRFDIGRQAPFTLGLGRVAPAHHKGLHVIGNQIAGQTLFRRKIEYVELVDLRRHDKNRPFVDLFGQGLVLDQFQHFVAEHHRALGHRQVLAHFEGIHVDLAGHAAVVGDVLRHMGQTVENALATGFEEALDRRRIERSVGRRHRFGQQRYHELGAGHVLSRQIGGGDPLIQFRTPGQVALHVTAI